MGFDATAPPGGSTERHERVFAPGADQMSWEALAALAQDLDGVGAVRFCALVEGEQ
jgi:hypothetical protein